VINKLAIHPICCTEAFFQYQDPQCKQESYLAHRYIWDVGVGAAEAAFYFENPAFLTASEWFV
jgi:hypothetical protein